MLKAIGEERETVYYFAICIWKSTLKKSTKTNWYQ